MRRKRKKIMSSVTLEVSFKCKITDKEMKASIKEDPDELIDVLETSVEIKDEVNAIVSVDIDTIGDGVKSGVYHAFITVEIEDEDSDNDLITNHDWNALDWEIELNSTEDAVAVSDVKLVGVVEEELED
jgi:hypothetical protein